MTPRVKTKCQSAPPQVFHKTRVGMISLGCPKTLVDSELILGKLDPEQYQIVLGAGDCDIALLNTCSFIQDAQKESIDRILELVEQKKQGKIQALVVMGCLVQEFPEILKKELREVDAFIGSGDYHKIPGIITQVTEGEKVFSLGTPGYLYTSAEGRVALTPKHYRYVKISEGCDHICSFCTIPVFRGKHRSRQLEDVLLEAKRLVHEGARELILTGQDTSYFGKDYSGKFLLADLLQALDRESGAHWIRLLYLYPSCVTSELIEKMSRAKHLCRYIDMPLQHASDRMLTAMRRGISKRRTLELIKNFRQAIPDLSFRTTFIVGFPGETEKDFDELLEFLNEVKFERVGIFKFSKEEQSHAATLSDQVSEKIKTQRWEKAMQVQQVIARENHKRFLGKTLEVLVESQSAKQPAIWTGRSQMDAPEIDGHVLIRTKKQLEIGEFYPVKIKETKEYDLVGEI